VTLKRLSVLDILEEFPSAALPLSDFLAMLPPMRVRQYSISSSPLADASIATLTWSVLDATSFSLSGKRFLGVASNYLANMTEGDRIHVTVKPAVRLFRPPADIEKTPVIMSCAGTGLAPFRGFVEERATQAQAGRKLAPAHLFIGCRHPDKDALLQKELRQWEKSGVVKVFYAFSRASKQSKGCKHVQDRLWNERALVKKGIFEDDAKFYVCGGAGLGKSVEEVMKKIYKDFSVKKTEEEVEAWFQGLKSDRYASEIFT
jgi:cytochrome P450 / NADPH-cytochrome P450 reductase